MSILELTTASGDSGLSVRRFSIREAISAPFSISLWACSPDASLDLGALVGRPASFRMVAGYAEVRGGSARAWSGLVSYAEQVHALQPAPGQTGLSTYYLRIVPALWLLTQRRGNRIYQHLSIPDIVDRLLAEWEIRPAWRIDRAQYPRLEYKVQYAETDYDFMSRLLEEAGIAFTFADDDASTLTLGDRLEENEPRPGPPLPCVDNPNEAAGKEFVTHVRLGREVRPGAAVVRDYDFRRPAFALLGESDRSAAPEDRYEQFHYQPGAFLAETGKPSGTPVADAHGFARHDQKHGQALADRALHGDRMGVRKVSFDANTFDVAPGVVLSIDNHLHPELSPERKLLVTETVLEGAEGGDWTLSSSAVFADVPYRPPRRTRKPVIHGLQSATVVGPPGEEIHADEFGRVRVQFPWDREGERDEHSSCWIRVHHGSAGAGWGVIALPRVGQEVLVSFLQGDPDQPMIVGRAYNAVQQVPYKLPDHRTRSAWKSDSSPGSGGFNEILFEDLKGAELVWQQAERDRVRVVENDEVATVGHDRQKLVKNDEVEETGGSRRRWVGKDEDLVTKGDRRERIVGDDHLEVRGSRREVIVGKQSLTVVEDRHDKVEGRYAVRAEEEIHHVGGEEHCGEAKEEVTLRGPGGFIRIHEDGITIRGTLVKINVSGSPGKGKGAKPEEPDEPER